MVKVYRADTKKLRNEALFRRLYGTVPIHRRERIDRLRYQKDQRLSLGAWLLLVEGMREWGIHDREMELSYGEGGKPFLRDHPDIFFSLSHSGEAVMCAVSDGEVGCDVEKVKGTDLRIARRFFHEREYACISREETPEARQRMFYRLWTLKESFMKVTGLGMRLSLDDFMISVGGDGIWVEQEVNRGCPYFFKEYFVQEDYQYACCSVRADFEENMRTVEFS